MMAKIIIDKQSYEVEEGQNLLQACLSLKLDLPYFCWHPSMGSVGACRQCAMTQYQDENDQYGRMIVACMTPVRDGMIVSMNQPSETMFREQVISALMTHHPHDCPVCAEGGECHLQDMTVMAGHHNRKYKGKKTTFTNQQLGPFIKHEMNRCITCYRCVRFYQDYAGGTDLAAQASKNHVYFGRQTDGTLESEFAGNLVEVCPTGVFTDKPFGDHYSRKWDLAAAPSVCQHCSVGCNITVSERYGSVRRVTNRLNDHLNGYFICDRGRFGFDFVNHANRSNEIRFNGAKVDWQDTGLQHCLQQPVKWIGVGSNQRSLEDNFALQQLVGAENFCATLDPIIESLLTSHVDITQQVAMPSLAEMEQADAIIILSEDINNSAPRIALAIRQALTNLAKSKSEALGIPTWQDAAVRQILPHNPVPLIVLGHSETALQSQATTDVACTPTDAENITQDIISCLSGIEKTTNKVCNDKDIASITKQLTSASRPLIVCGWQAKSAELMRSALQLFNALENPHAMLCVAAQSANDLGLGALMCNGYLSAQNVASTIKNESCGLLVLDNTDTQLKHQLKQLKPLVKCIVRLSMLSQNKIDDINLPIAAFSECSGSSVNYQGRMQHFTPATKSIQPCMPAWQWLVHIAKTHQHHLGEITNLAELRQWMSEALGISEAAEQSTLQRQSALQTPRASGRTAMLANQTVHEPKPAIDVGAPYKQTMEGSTPAQSDEQMRGYTWSPGWNSNQSNHKFKHEYRGTQLESQSGVALFGNNLNTIKQPVAITLHTTANKLILLPTLEVFGSESLSLFSTSVHERQQDAYIIVHPKTAATFNIHPQQYVCLDDSNTIFSVSISEHTPANTVVVFVPADHYFPLSDCQSIQPATEEQLAVFDEIKSLRQSHLEAQQLAHKERLLQQDECIPIHFIQGADDG